MFSVTTPCCNDCKSSKVIAINKKFVKIRDIRGQDICGNIMLIYVVEIQK